MSSSSSSFLPCLVAYAQKASGGNQEKGAAGTGAGEAVAHIELAAVTLMSKVIRRGFFHLLFSLISISHSSLSSKCVSLLLLLLILIFFLLIPSRTARIQLFSHVRFCGS
jgi:CBS domain containing-hemolysin-like protein